MPDFANEYHKLNKEQQLAVDSLDGPVMVIAGAGTGKTQTIALRIANILQKTQTPPSSILCLTFTDSAVNAMRSRLIDIIGPTAYSVHIHTFHSFCNEIIQKHPEYFIFGKDIEPLDDLEKVEVINNLIDSLPDNSVLKPWGDHYFYQRDISSGLQTVKRESISVDKLSELIEDEVKFISNTVSQFEALKKLRVSKTLATDLQNIVDSIPNNSLISYHTNLYKNGGYEIGAAKNPAINFKNALIKIIDNLTKDVIKQKEFLFIYQGYQLELKQRGRYDFDDMILSVVKAFKDQSDLLMEYQELYQYFLVDEYQDTNNAQNELLSLLCSYFDNPNMFVVGDDDQSIFRFQGASIENVFGFYQKYKVAPIVLKNNYRSHQLILDTSSSVIKNNQNRIANYIKDIDKSLKSVSTIDPDPINLIPAGSVLEENYFICQKIKSLISLGVAPNQIAILYRNNADIIDLAVALSREKIKFYLPSDQNILESPHIKQLINLLTYIVNPLRNDLFYHILASDYLHLNAIDLLKITRSGNLSDPTLSKNTKAKLKNLNIRLGVSIRWLENLSPDRFFNKVIRRFKYLKYCLGQNDPQILNHLLAFHSEFKKQTGEKKLTASQFLERLDLLSANNLGITAPPLTIDAQDSIQLLTVHRAKGLEFEHVFLIKVIDKKWGNTRDMSHLRLPHGILKYEVALSVEDQNEDERRLFYVALTRAKKQIYISYSTKTNTNRDQIPSIFISEIDPHLIEINAPPKDSQLVALQKYFPIVEPHLDQKYTDYLKNVLTTDYVFNVTHLNSYLRCPYCFYHQTILRIPAVKDKFSSLGTAVHHALSYLYLHQGAGIDSILSDFAQSLGKEGLGQFDYQETHQRGLQTLTEYYNFYKTSLCPNVLVDYDFRSANIHLGKIPITGKIDLIEQINNHQINVVDFKTGNPDSKSKELSPEGDYFRQLVFYKLLISLDPTFKQQLNFGIIDFVQKSKLKDTYVRKEINITEQDVENLQSLIKEIYTKIIKLDFFHLGPDCKDNQHVHYLLKT